MSIDFERHPVFGFAFRSRGWVPAPSYLLRRQRVLKIMKTMAPGDLLEIGCGAGALLHDLLALGFRCTAVETAPAAHQLARDAHAGNAGVTILDCLPNNERQRFDAVVALEVLEHIEDDHAALRGWTDVLKPGGHLVLSVPAHARRWSASDEWAGHFRRYERSQLEDVMKQSGLAVEHIECYGFPLSNMLEPLRARAHARRMAREPANDTRRWNRADGTARSGIERSVEVRLYPMMSSRVGTKLMQGFFLLQNVFLRTELGPGFIAVGTRI